jgi:AcrR family transcriptional regulator
MSSAEPGDPRRTEEELRAYWSGLDLLWDAAATPAAGPRRGALDLGRIVAAAVAIADAEGLDAVSMRRVASKVGSGPMSLYRHVPDKDALVLLMIDAALAEQDDREASPPSGDWRADLRLLADLTWKVMRRHPWLPEAMISRPPLTPRGVAGLEWALSIFDGHDVDITTKMQFVGSVHFTVLSAALNAAIEDRTRARLNASDAQIMDASTSVMTRIAETGRYPHVVEFVVEGKHLEDGEQMLAAVELVLDGIGARLG